MVEKEMITIRQGLMEIKIWEKISVTLHWVWESWLIFNLIITVRKWNKKPYTTSQWLPMRNPRNAFCIFHMSCDHQTIPRRLLWVTICWSQALMCCVRQQSHSRLFRAGIITFFFKEPSSNYYRLVSQTSATPIQLCHLLGMQCRPYLNEWGRLHANKTFKDKGRTSNLSSGFGWCCCFGWLVGCFFFLLCLLLRLCTAKQFLNCSPPLIFTPEHSGGTRGPQILLHNSFPLSLTLTLEGPVASEVLKAPLDLKHGSLSSRLMFLLSGLWDLFLETSTTCLLGFGAFATADDPCDGPLLQFWFQAH